jgi:hypothetical protein
LLLNKLKKEDLKVNKEELRKLAIESVENELNALNDFADNEGHPNVQVMLAVCMRIDDLEDQLEELQNPKRRADVHTYFGLSYADYLVIPRSVLQSMPMSWQYNFVKLLDELDDTEWRDLLPKDRMYKVELRDYGYEYNEEIDREEFTWKQSVRDPLGNYDRGRKNIFE